MSLSRIWAVLRKDLALGPRSPFFLYTLVLPIVLTVLFQFAFGSLFEPRPRLGIVDSDGSAIVTMLRQAEGIELTLIADAVELKEQVEANDLDAGLVLPAGFDEAVRGGERPVLEFYIGGESYASNRAILTVTALDAIRALEGDAAPVTVELVSLGEEGLPITLRLVPIIIFYALVLSGVFVPGSSLVEEKERGTLSALLVSPVKVSEILVAKWSLGVLLTFTMAMLTLVLNSAIGGNPFDVVIVILVAAILTSMLGLLVGVVSKDSTMMFGLIKGVGVFLFAPVLWYLFPDWPQWIAKLFPLYWIIEPIWQVSILGGSIVDVAAELAIALGMAMALLPLIIMLARRMQAQMAAR
ncbi:MAG: ABC transporter permease [Clostridiales bacterium]|nr:ABC transporter permease [Clostridiales bacterium]